MKKEYSDRRGGNQLIGVSETFTNRFEAPSNYGGSSFLLELTNIEFGQIGNNDFNNNSTATLTAIQVKDCRDMVISENEITAFDRGLTFVDNNIRAQFSCNVFDDCMTGVYFHNATMSDQGDANEGANNEWYDPASGGNFRMDGNVDLIPSIAYFHYNGNSDFDPDAGIGLSATFGFSSFDLWPINFSGCFAVAQSQKTALEESASILVVYPNPFEEAITINAPTPFSYSIFDVLGRGVASGKSLEPQFSLRLELPSGLYTLIVVGDDNKPNFFKLLRK